MVALLLVSSMIIFVVIVGAHPVWMLRLRVVVELGLASVQRIDNWSEVMPADVKVRRLIWVMIRVSCPFISLIVILCRSVS